MQLFLPYFLLINCLAFFANGADKWLAANHKWRISERTLLGLVVAGGTLGAGVGMLLFRHKTAKKSYLFIFIGLVFLQLLSLFLYLKFNPVR